MMTSASSFSARGQTHPPLSEGLDPVGDDLGLAVAKRVEEVAAGDEAEALVPGVIARFEVGVDVVAGGQAGLGALADEAAHRLRGAAGELVAEHHPQHVLPAHDRVDRLRRKTAAQRCGETVLCGQGDDVGGRALQHRHPLGPLGHRRDQRHRGGAAADHHDPLADVVEVLRPVLGVDDPALEALAAGELRRVALVVAVIASAAVEEVAGQLDRLAAGALGDHGPARLPAAPLGAHHPVAEADVLLDAVLARGLVDVVADLAAVGDRVGVFPGAERVAEREHVGVGADAGVAEEVPGAADRRAGLEDRVALARTVAPQVAGGADAGEAGADDQDIDVVGGNLCSLGHRRIIQAQAEAPTGSGRGSSQRPKRSRQ